MVFIKFATVYFSSKRYEFVSVFIICECNLFNIPSITSDEANYLVEVEENYSEKQDAENNSTNRILEMKKRLKKVKKGN